MIVQIGVYDMDGFMLDLGSNVNILRNKTWEVMGKKKLVYYLIYINTHPLPYRLLHYYHCLEYSPPLTHFILNKNMYIMVNKLYMETTCNIKFEFIDMYR